MSRRFSDWDLECKVYIGSISSRTTKDDIESLFSRYGPLRNVWIARNPPGFAFVEFEDRRDAEEAVAELDGTRLCGQRIRVEMSHGKTRRDRRSDSRRSPARRSRYSRSRSRSPRYSRDRRNRSYSRERR
ncbi:RNA-binding protein 1-like isoform X2 [Argiope bruennichi]|uniref:RNA-binding protein 1-like isoform X2 n=1 Tax=Argiope bruennichi TaxID=94029 RepID=UPI002494ACC1|nr:RNA-binding protein 1-like isoform X2 [Argiope bruennichi]